MRSTSVLSGPAAAAAYGLDGFKDLVWPLSWCAPPNGSRAFRVLRTRRWQEGSVVDGIPLAASASVLRQIGAFPEDLEGLRDGIAPADRLELALEHCLRAGWVSLDNLTAGGGSCPGDALLRHVLRRREPEVPTESYAETRAIQHLRSLGVRCWRQMAVWHHGRIRHRVDLVIPASRTVRFPPRPELLRPDQGLLVEIDSREFHERKFEEDHRRQTLYDALGFNWVSFTPSQMERELPNVQRAIAVALRRVATSRG